MKLSEARHAFITGGASGFGLAFGDALAARGIRVTLADVDADALKAVLAERGAEFRAAQLDVRDREAWARVRDEAEAAFGPVDLLFNNAGIAPDGLDLADMPPESFDRVIGINLGGVFNGVSAFGGAMRARGRGHIVNTSSMSGMVADNPGLGSYSPSKFAVVALTEVLRQEMEPHGVGVSVFCPGTTATNLMENTVKRGGALQRPGSTLRGFPVTPEAIAPVVLDGIERNLAYIFTHPERRAAVEARHAGILAGFEAMKETQ
jgi:NAD(P)-dependent dehydrogenase (short-subunit alcohol dehydrogenase family)